jgi:Uncharacterized protein conserved in bacteria (DUF2066)
MTFKPWAGLIALVLGALCAFASAPASAQPGRDTAFSVSGVLVDQTAANAAAAQEAGFALARRMAFERLVRRLTVPAELAGRPPTAPDAAALERLVLSVDVADERRSSTRYIGRLTVRFDAAGVRTLLRSQGLTVVETRTAAILVVPTAMVGMPAETLALWREAWTRGGYGDELAPLVVAPEALQGPPDWRAAQAYAQAEGASAALYATLRVQNGVAAAAITEINAEQRRDRGEITAPVASADPAAMRAAFAAMAEQVNLRLQNEWKARVATGGGQRARVSASALYRDQRQWESIKQALEGAAQTLISEIRIEAVGREGALVSFSFVGDRTQLNAELGRRGVRLEDSQMGPVLRVTGN